MARKKQTSQNQSSLILRGLIGLCALLAAADFIIHRHAYFNVEATPLFFALMGAGSMGLVALISLILRKAVTRPEDYYEHRHEADDKKGGKNA
jgi:hypothetical protein